MVDVTPPSSLRRFSPSEAFVSRLAARTRRSLVEPELRPSAVAILLTESERDDGDRQLWVPLIVRPADAPTHSGQIALPGGGVHANDESFGATAQREAHEELGVPTTSIDVLGMIDDVPTPAQYCITPVLCAFSPQPFVPDAREVASYFWAPVELFADHAAAEYLGERAYRGVTYHMRAYHWQGHRIWGATARILEQVAGLVAR